MEFKETRGEWEYFNNGTFCEIQIKKPFLKSICAVNSNIEEHIANATLIACAPELLNELQNIIKEYDLDIVKGIDARKIRELIKKATTI